MIDLTHVIFGVFLAASLPFVISILVSLKPNLSLQTAEDYFLNRRRLPVSDFIPTTIGYSLQVSAIYLFFFWGIQYGVWPIIMCLTWFAGYALMAFLVYAGKLDSFLDIKAYESRRDDTRHVATIHGYIGQRMSPPIDKRQGNAAGQLPRSLAILALSLASVIGVAGTMMTEIDYSTQFFLQAIGMTSDPPASYWMQSAGYWTQLCMLLFTTFYVLYGGFRAAVLTDRLQVPAAYVGLGVFTVGLSFYAEKGLKDGSVVLYLLMFLLGLYIALLFIRLSAVRKRGNEWNKITAWVTFASLLLLTGCAAFRLYQRQPPTLEGLEALWRIMFPEFKPQFVFLGGLSLLITNLLWQLIDISSLQRLQAVNTQDVDKYRSEIAWVIGKTGAESALGWVLIIVCALLLQIVGLEGPKDLIPNLLSSSGWFPFLVPVFVLTVVVFMLSTVSGFISCVAYVAHSDIAPALGIYEPRAESRSGNEIMITRFVTLICVVLIYLGYSVLQSTSKGDIATMLYAIWSFQLAITPAVLAAFFAKNSLSPWAVILSVLCGVATGGYVATHHQSDLCGIPVGEAWSMLPPLAVVVVSSVVFRFATFVHQLIGMKSA